VTEIALERLVADVLGLEDLSFVLTASLANTH
jgi:hypothetical protein